MKLDLHVHSTASDGASTPAEVVSLAAEGGLDVLALADHDTVVGVADAMTASEERTVRIIPAIELSSTWKNRDLHILGYFVRTEARAILEHQEQASSRRVERMGQMIDRLRDSGIEVGMDEVLEVAGPEHFSVGRPHLAKALLQLGHVRSVKDAFDRLIGDDHEAYVPTRLLSPLEAIACIRGSGGIAVWAHPPLDLIRRFLGELTHGGLRGLEVYRPHSRPDTVLELERQARLHGLLVTGGSDWHDPQAGPALGDFFVTEEEVAELLEEGGF